MSAKGIQVCIDFIPKAPLLEEELFHCITYIVQQFVCSEDADRIESFLDEANDEYEFIGEKTRIILTQTPESTSQKDD